MKPLIDFKKLVLRIWIILWAILFTLVILKLVFNIWYPIFTYNESFIDICNKIEQYPVIKIIIGSIFYAINTYIIFVITIVKKKIKLLPSILIILASIGISTLKYFYPYIGFVPECILVIIIPIIYNILNKTFHKDIWNVLFPIIVNLVLMLWQVVMLFIRNLTGSLTNIPFLIDMLLQFDYYIFLIITYIGVCQMGYFGLWFWSKQKTELEAMKAAELKKDHPDEKLLAEIDASLKKVDTQLAGAKKDAR